MAERQLYVLPEKFDTMEMREAMEWATDEVLRLDAENQILREKVAEYERRAEIQARGEGGTLHAHRHGANAGTSQHSALHVLPSTTWTV